MLVLRRKPGERVLIGEDIGVVVLEVEGDRVKLGFTAPRHVPIFRAEIHRDSADDLAATGTEFS
jgi:carbon storage regulator